ncbi:MAG: DUF3786 domain-containing protein [Treponema sp.]|jgi:hypothetical protein|nr:DUF3786 domain-containing protein [Treponema sp.]
MKTEKKDHVQRSLDHFKSIYRTLTPAEIARRCALPFLRTESAFELCIMGKTYLAKFPEFELRDMDGRLAERGYENILFLRYLCEGRYTEATGKRLSYREIPWGEVYYQNFERRCIKRLADAFGNDLENFQRIMETLRAEALDKGDAGYRFEFIKGLYMDILLWAGDDEFPPSAQILFNDNFVSAFTAEDIAVVGEVLIARLKETQKGLFNPFSEYKLG